MEPRANDKIKAIFEGALEQSSPPDREAYVARACAGDAALRRRVGELLRAHDQADSLLDRPAAEFLTGASDADAAESDDGWLNFLTPPTRPGSLGRLGHYEILEVAGRGGMGIVFRAFDDKLQRVVAIKALAPALATSPRSRQQFVREARAAAAVTHENVIAIYGVEDSGPVPYLVMQFIDGVSLEDKVERTGPLPLNAILRIGLHIAEGLTAAHRQGLVHRDVKPSNILLENGVERVKITDFGLARAGDDATLTVSGLLTGTPTYMSPEQAQGEPVDFSSDLFSLGGVMYAMCTGEPPFRASSTLAVLKRVREESPRPIREVNPELPAWLEELVTRLHAKSPADRPASAREVADVLARRLAELQDGKTFGPAEVPAPPPSRRRWLTAVAVPLALLAVLVLTEAAGLTRIRGGFTAIKSDAAAPQASVPRRPAPAAAPASATLTDTEWEQSIAGLSPDEQAKVVAARLKVLNPGFGGFFTHISSDGDVVDFRFSSERVANITPLRALRRLKVLHCAGSMQIKSPLKDLSPLKGLRLEVLLCPHTHVADLSVVAGMPMLALDCEDTNVSELTPLTGMSLVHVVVSNTRVSDLTPLRGMPLNHLAAEGTAISDFSPIERMPLKSISLNFQPARDAATLRSIKTLEHINHMPAAEFWKRQEK